MSRAPLRDLVTTLLLALAALLLYLPSLHYGFVYYDDVRILADHSELYNQPTLRETVNAICVTELPREEPLLLRDLSWALDSRLFGFPNPLGFHFTNILLHAFVVALCFRCLLCITRRYAIALIASICFVTLAVHVEPVAWLMGRKDLLVAAFGFLALIGHSRALDATASGPRLMWYGASFGAVLLALFSKISAIVFPEVLFLLALFQPALRSRADAAGPFPWRRIPGALAGVLPHFVASLLVYHWYHGVVMAFGLLNRGYTATPLEHLRNLLILNPLAFLRDLQNLLYPRHLALLHAWPGNLTVFHTVHVVTAAAVLILLAAIGALFLIKRRDLAFYFFAFWVLMVPYLNLTYIGIWVANRYLYFSAFCLLAIAATLVADALRRAPRSWGIAALALTGLFAAGNAWCLAQYLPVWQNAETLWKYEMQLPGAVPDAYCNLAAYYYTDATRFADPEEREVRMLQTAQVVAQARERYQSPTGALPRSLGPLLVMDALVTIARNEPPERQIAALLAAAELVPNDEAVLWQLMTFRYKEALRVTDEAQRAAGAREALAYYWRYRTIIYRDTGFAARDRAIRDEFRRDFPFLGAELENQP